MSPEIKSESIASSRKELMPSYELFTPDGYRWRYFSETLTGLPLVALEDMDTGVVVSTTLASPDKRVASLRAWGGARHSRAPGYSWDIMHEIVEKEVDTDEKIKETFLGYGHASPADMAWLGVHIENVPMHFCMSVFNNLSLNGGQEKSTRYQKKFGESPVGSLKDYLPPGFLAPELERRYHALAKTASAFFAKHRLSIEEKYRAHFQPKTAGHEAALTARTLDTARVFLLLGQDSSQFIGDTARNISRLLSEIKSSSIPLYGRIAQQVERLLAPTESEEKSLKYQAEAPALIRHTEASRIVNDNLRELREYLLQKTNLSREVQINTTFRGMVPQEVEYLPRWFYETERMVAEYVISLWPGLDHTQALAWIARCTKEQKQQMAGIILNGHDHKHELPGFARTSSMTAIVNGSLAEVRDLNRHRSLGRFIELPLVFGLPMTAGTFEQILAKGYVLPLYLTEVPEFAGIKAAVVEDLNNYYHSLYDLFSWTKNVYGESIDYSFFANLLPLSHQISIWLHFDPKSALYTSKLRYRPGGHINYRDVAWRISNLISEAVPYFMPLKIEKRPDPGSREEFFDRS